MNKEGGWSSCDHRQKVASFLHNFTDVKFKYFAKNVDVFYLNPKIGPCTPVISASWIYKK